MEKNFSEIIIQINECIQKNYQSCSTRSDQTNDIYMLSRVLIYILSRVLIYMLLRVTSGGRYYPFNSHFSLHKVTNFYLESIRFIIFICNFYVIFM